MTELVNNELLIDTRAILNREYLKSVIHKSYFKGRYQTPIFDKMAADRFAQDA